jgi:hypothetical protein
MGKSESVPTTLRVEMKEVGTAQARLCPPYDFIDAMPSIAQGKRRVSPVKQRCGYDSASSRRDAPEL